MFAVLVGLRGRRHSWWKCAAGGNRANNGYYGTSQRRDEDKNQDPLIQHIFLVFHSTQERHEVRATDEDFDQEAEANLTDEEQIEFSVLREVAEIVRAMFR